MMIRITYLGWALAAASAVLSGCGSSDDAGSASAAPVGEASYAQEVAQTICETAAKCTCTGNVLTGDACVQDVLASIQQETTEQKQAGLTYDADCAGKRVARFAEAGCNSRAVTSSRCGSCSVYHGSKKLGEACNAYPDDCAQGLACAGVCVDPCKPVANGEPCASRITVCVEGSTCSALAGVAGACQPTKQLGSACEGLGECGDGRYCTAEGQCAKSKTVGASCETPTECLDSTCNQGTCASTYEPGTREPDLCSWVVEL